MNVTDFIAKYKLGEDALKELRGIITDSGKEKVDAYIIKSGRKQIIADGVEVGDIIRYEYDDTSGDIGIAVSVADKFVSWMDFNGGVSNLEGDIVKLILVAKKDSPEWHSIIDVHVGAIEGYRAKNLSSQVPMLITLGIKDEYIKRLEKIREKEVGESARIKQLNEEINMYKVVLDKISPVVKEIVQRVIVDQADKNGEG